MAASGRVSHPLLGLCHWMEGLPDCDQVGGDFYLCGRYPLIVDLRFIHLLWVNFKAKWRNQTVGELFLKTAERLPDKVRDYLKR